MADAAAGRRIVRPRQITWLEPSDLTNSDIGPITFRSLAVAGCLLALSLSAASATRETSLRPGRLPDKAEVERAYQAAKGAVVNANLLSTSAQARLKRLQFAFNQAGAAELRDRSRAAFEAYTRRLSAFREAADAADAARPGAGDAREKAAAAAAPAPPPEAPTNDLLGQIAALRAGYDAGSTRRRAAEARRILESWGPAGPKLTAAQESALKEGRSLVSETRSAAKRLAPKSPLKAAGPAQAVAGELKALAEDAAALELELELLAARFRVDSLVSKHPELGGT